MRDFYDYDNIPNCVPEMFREQFEREAREAELRWERAEHYNANQKKLAKANADGYPVLDYGGYDACWECKDADHDTQTADGDDFCRVICKNPSCPEHEKHKEQAEDKFYEQ